MEEVRREAWDSEVVTTKNAEVQQSRSSLLDFIDETQVELKTIADRLKVNVQNCQVAASPL